MLKVHVSGFGPIIEGGIALKPLMVFVGANNSGKSYFAMLLYSLFHSVLFRGIYWVPGSRVRRQRLRQHRFIAEAPSLEPDKETLAFLKEWIEQLGDVRSWPKRLTVRDLPDNLQEVMVGTIKSSSREFISSIGREVRRCYGSEISDLAHREHPNGSFNVSIEHSDPLWHLDIRSVGKRLEGELTHVDISNMTLDFPRYPIGGERRRSSTISEPLLQDIFLGLRFEAQWEFYKDFWTDTYYFPAARSGILQNHKALASFVVSRSPLVGIEPLDIPRFTGVVTDFISELLILEKRRATKLTETAKFLEAEVTKGTITIEVGRLEYPEIYYEANGGKFPLHRTSSMVSELAPIVLFLKYVVDPGDFLIIEEPESHLHPENQRRLARTLVKLVRKNVRVLITTHSDYFLGQLSNFIRLSKVSEDERVNQGYSPEDFLMPEDVGTYLFDLDQDKGGSFIKEVPVTAEDGIPEEEFTKVAEALYQETVRLERRISL